MQELKSFVKEWCEEKGAVKAGENMESKGRREKIESKGRKERE